MNAKFGIFSLIVGYLISTISCSSSKSNEQSCEKCTCTCSSGAPFTQTTTTCPPTTQDPSSTTCSCPTTERTDVFTETDCTKCETYLSTSTSTEMTSQSRQPSVSQGALELGMSSDPSPGIIVGAAIGGALFGFITSLIIFVILCRKSTSSGSSSKDNATFFESQRNPAYQYEDNASPETPNLKDSSQTSTAYSEISDGMLKTARIAPIKKYEEPAIKDSVYNHLNESDKVDRSDYYDHAGPAPSMSVIEEGYGVVSLKSESKSERNGDYNKVDRKINAGNERNDNYFTLEVQED